MSDQAFQFVMLVGGVVAALIQGGVIALLTWLFKQVHNNAVRIAVLEKEIARGDAADRDTKEYVAAVERRLIAQLERMEERVMQRIDSLAGG